MYKALIADDESFIRDGLRAILPWHDYNVAITHEAVDGDEAAAILQEESIDLLISDIRMPGRSGIDLLREIRDRAENTRVIVLSGYDDFEYVRDAAVLGIDNYLLKPIDREELRTSVERAVSRLESERSRVALADDGIHRLRGNLFFKLVTGKTTPEKFGEKWPVFATISPDAYIQVAVFDQPINTTRQLLRELRDRLEDTEQDFVLVNIDETVVVLFTDRNDPGEPSRRIRKLHSALSDDGWRLRLAVGEVKRGIAGIVTSYWTALRLLRAGEMSDLAWAEDSTVAPAADELQIDRYHEIRRLFRNYRFPDLRRFVERALREVFAGQNNDPDAVLEIVFSVLHGLRRAVPRHRQQSLPPDAQIVGKLLPAPRFEDARRECLQLIDQAEQMIPAAHGGHSHIVQLTLRTIFEDLSVPMNLKTIAAELNVNPNYLGQLFRAETGESFTGYLNRVRLREAKRLLSESSAQIQTIARQVGFTDKGYFTRVFRESEGLTPSEYRKKLLVDD